VLRDHVAIEAIRRWIDGQVSDMRSRNALPR
jgi:hypothetical protein